MNIINLTPHSINFVSENGTVIFTINPSGTIARCQQVKTEIGSINSIPVFQTSYGAVSGVPEKAEDTIYVVSSLVATALKGIRDDVYVPLDFVRNEQGAIVGCKSLGKI